jgi:hypothetical protein
MWQMKTEFENEKDQAWRLTSYKRDKVNKKTNHAGQSSD